jgi:deoxyadenosine/deoxycytidine kinase
MLKISFSGFSGSGKTSLLTEVKKILSLKYNVESTDELKSKIPFDDNQKYTFISQFYYFSSQINEENIKAMSAKDFLLTDQSILDEWVYWKNHIANLEMTPQLEEKNNILENIYRFWIKTYDLIFWIRMDLKELEKREFYNDLKITDLETIKHKEDLYKEIAEEDKLGIIEIWNNNTVDESAHEIIKHISEFKGNENSEGKEETPAAP